MSRREEILEDVSTRLDMLAEACSDIGNQFIAGSGTDVAKSVDVTETSLQGGTVRTWPTERQDAVSGGPITDVRRLGCAACGCEYHVDVSADADTQQAQLNTQHQERRTNDQLQRRQAGLPAEDPDPAGQLRRLNRASGADRGGW